MGNLQLTNRINALLAEKGIEKKTFYEDCNITSSAYSQWSTGKTAPRLKKLNEIAEYLNVPVSFLTEAEYEIKKAPAETGESLQDLKDDERVLLDSYRGMTEKDRELMRDFARRLKGDS